MRGGGKRGDAAEEAHAASGVKSSAPDWDGGVAGTTLRVVHSDSERSEALAAARAESELSIELEEEGVCIKADTVGGLEALAKELNAIEVPIRMASIGKVSRRDIRKDRKSVV